MVGYDPANRIAVIIPNYNMPEKADAIVDTILGSSDHRMFDIYLVDNGSDLVAKAKHTTVSLPINCQTTGAILCGMAAAGKKVSINKHMKDYLAYWVVITSTTLKPDIDYISVGIQYMMTIKELVGYSPALDDASSSAWMHLFSRDSITLPFIFGSRRVWMLDNIATFWRKDWLDSIGRFDPRLTYAWGIDLETSYLARKQNKVLMVSDNISVNKTTDIGYSMNRMNMSAYDRRAKAYANMKEVLSQRYGPDWESIMRNAYVNPEWR